MSEIRVSLVCPVNSNIQSHGHRTLDRGGVRIVSGEFKCVLQCAYSVEVAVGGSVF